MGTILTTYLDIKKLQFDQSVYFINIMEKKSLSDF